jgi:hypothetical protein
MKMKQKYAITIIGLIFSIVCFISTFTFILPILTLLPSGILEFIFSTIIGDKPYKNIGICLIVTLTLIFIISTYIFTKTISVRPERIKYETIFYFTIQVFIIPPLFFYINTSRNWDKASDGQFFFGIFETFPVSCLTFFFIGLFIDLYRMTKGKEKKVSN